MSRVNERRKSRVVSIQMIDPLGDPGAAVMEDTRIATAMPWMVVIHDDPVNTIEYVILTIQRLFGYARAKAEHHTMEVHHRGRSVVWNGAKEKAELYVHQLHAAQLKASLERSDE